MAFRKAIPLVSGAVGTLMIVLVENKPKDAKSNLTAWAQEIGIESASLPKVLDQAVYAIGVVLVIAALCYWLWLQQSRGKPDQITYADAMRRMGHGSRWSLRGDLMAPAEWAREANSEMLEALSRGKIEAWGLWRPTNGEPDNAPRKIEREEWPKLKPELRLILERRMSLIHHSGDKRENGGIFIDVKLDRATVEHLWPRWSLGARISRIRNAAKHQSFAERSGELSQWRRRNDGLPKTSEYYWNEPK